jgi:hypothetical protein
MSTIFYSQVNKALQQELVARGTAGVTNRKTAAISYMVEKIANIEISAYDSKPTKETKAMKGFGILGGVTVLQGSYMPSGVNGFLNDKLRPSHRIPPVITDLNISMNDQSKSYINKASVSILILDATTDMEEMEEIWCKPGRHIKIKIVHPDSAILTDGILSPDGLPSTDKLKVLYPDTEVNNLRRMNEMYFQGRISTFSFTYNPDGSVSLSIEAIGTSNTYVDVSLYMGAKQQTSQTGVQTTNQVESIYTALSSEVDAIIKTYNEKQVTEFEHLIANKTDHGILVGIPYTVGNTNAPEAIRMVTLAYLIDYINTKIYQQIDSTISINCNDEVCFSNYYEKLVSANPNNILLWQGTSAIESSTYSVKNATDGTDEFKMFPKVKATSPGFSINNSDGGRSYPSRIYINLELIKKIIDDITKANDATIKQLLIKLSNEIKSNTGNAINLALVQDPIISEALLFYDTNFVTTNTLVKEFTLPVFATATGASVVRQFTLTSNVPNTVKNMIFGIDSAKSSTQKQTAYNPYIYADAENKKRLEKEWAEDYLNAIETLKVRKRTYALRPNDPENINNLIKSLEDYVIHFTPDITKSIGLNKSIFPMELEFTIDGINGFKYGDVLNFAGLPKRYTDSFIFTVLGITHSVSTAGEWITTIKCNPRIRIKE